MDKMLNLTIGIQSEAEATEGESEETCRLVGVVLDSQLLRTNSTDEALEEIDRVFIAVHKFATTEANQLNSFEKKIGNAIDEGKWQEIGRAVDSLQTP
jgi:hypothetical protein